MEDPCLRNTLIQVFDICKIILLLFFIAKLYNSWFLYENKINLFDLKYKTKIVDITINKILIVLVIIVILFGGLSPLIFKNISCSPVGSPVGPIQANGYLITVVLNDIYTLSDAKNSICESISKCVNPNELIINSYRVYDTETRISFRSLTGDITQNDINNSPNIKFTYSDIFKIVKPEISIISFKDFENQELDIPLLVQAPTPQPTNAPIPQLPIINDDGLTFPPSTNQSDMINVCDNLEWTDSEGRNCSFYTSQNICFQFGTDPNNLGMVTNSDCSSYTDQDNCESNKSRIGNSMCNWDVQCIPKSISASDACCLCSGGEINQYLAPPTSAPVPALTSAPTSAPTTAPTTYAESEPVLAIKGIAEFGNTGYKEWYIPLYIYNLEFYNPGIGSERFIEKYFFGKIPSVLGEHPQFNTESGEFEGLPNAIVSTEAGEIPVPSGIELKTEPVENLPGFYYLFIKSKDCNDKFIPLYTQPNNTSFSSSYYSILDENGRVSNANILLGCKEVDYSCICEESETEWDSNSSRYIGYPPIPPILYENCPVSQPSSEIDNNIQDAIEFTKHPYVNNPKYTKTCKLGADLDRLWIREVAKTTILYENSATDTGEEIIEGSSFDTKILYGFTKDQMENSCPTEYTICNNDVNCKNSLQIINNQWDKLKQIDMTNVNNTVELLELSFGISQDDNNPNNGIISNKELYNLKKCVSEMGTKLYESESQTCEFMKNYYKYCKVGTDVTGAVRDLREGDLSEFDTINMSQFIEFFTMIIIEPMCIYNSTQPSKDFWLPFFKQYKKDFFIILMTSLFDSNKTYEDIDFNAFPLSAADYAYRATNIWEEIQTDCCTGYVSKTTKPEFNPISSTAEIQCEDSDVCVIL